MKTCPIHSSRFSTATSAKNNFNGILMSRHQDIKYRSLFPTEQKMI